MIIKSDAQQIFDMSLTHPPLVPETFDREYRDALADVMASFSPSEMVGAHRWMGTEADREAGAVFVGGRLGSVPDAGRVVVTGGVQSAFNMLFGGLIGRDAVLAVEELTYPPVMTVANRYGFTLCGVKMDGEGLLPDALEQACKERRPKGLFVMSTLQNPTTATMSLRRREAIVEVARKYDLAIIEDDIYSLLPETNLPPLSALAPERGWYLLGAGKSIASGLKIAYVVAPTVEQAEATFWPGVRATYWMAAPINAAVSTRLIENGGANRVVEAVRKEMKERHQIVRPLIGRFDAAAPDGSLHLWVQLPKHIPAKLFAKLALENGISLSTAAPYAAPGAAIPEAVRVCIGHIRSHSVLADAVQTLLDVWGQTERHGI